MAQETADVHTNLPALQNVMMNILGPTLAQLIDKSKYILNLCIPTMSSDANLSTESARQAVLRTRKMMILMSLLRTTSSTAEFLVAKSNLSAPSMQWSTLVLTMIRLMTMMDSLHHPFLDGESTPLIAYL